MRLSPVIGTPSAPWTVVMVPHSCTTSGPAAAAVVETHAANTATINPRIGPSVGPFARRSGYPRGPRHDGLSQQRLARFPFRTWLHFHQEIRLPRGVDRHRHAIAVQHPVVGQRGDPG